MNNAVFRKNMENVRNHRDIKLITNKARRNYLASEANYYKNIFRWFISNGKEENTDTHK